VLDPHHADRSEVDERRLVVAAAGGDAAARRELVDVFLPSIAGIARRYRSAPVVTRPELMQEGIVGLLCALERYDLERDTPFWAYASWWVRQAMQGLVAELTRPVVLSDRALRQLAHLRRAEREALQEQGREPSTAELAERTGIPLDQAEHLFAVDRAPRGLAEPLRSDGCDGATTLLDFLADPSAQDEYDGVARRVGVEQLRGVPSVLTRRERAVLRARYGLGCREHTLKEIAGRLRLSAERVRQIEQQGLEKIRAASAQRAPSSAQP
jgi:RNA polymerase primary sigma factor